MKIANVSGRLALIRDEGGVDVAATSGGRFGPDPQAVYSQWKAFREWADDAPAHGVVRGHAREIAMTDPLGEALDDGAPSFRGRPLQPALDPRLTTVVLERFLEVDLRPRSLRS